MDISKSNTIYMVFHLNLPRKLKSMDLFFIFLLNNSLGKYKVLHDHLDIIRSNSRWVLMFYQVYFFYMRSRTFHFITFNYSNHALLFYPTNYNRNQTIGLFSLIKIHFYLQSAFPIQNFHFY